MKVVLIPVWAVKLAIQHHGRVYAYSDGVGYHLHVTSTTA